MNERDIGIPIPLELMSSLNKNSKKEILTKHFDIKNNPPIRMTRDSEELFNCIEYYNPDMTLSKKIYYTLGKISCIKKYKNGTLIYKKDYNQENNKLELITYYSSNKEEISKIKFKYSRDNRITGISKIFKDESYGIEYDYDALYRVNLRKIIINDKVVDEEKFKLDILERILEYKNNNICIYILERTKNSKLAKYKIIDNDGNELFIHNNFDANEKYLNTEIMLNGNKTVTKNLQYLNNQYLKKPYTSPEDLDFVIMRYSNDIHFFESENVINLRVNKTNILPITIRKLNLYNMANTAINA